MPMSVILSCNKGICMCPGDCLQLLKRTEKYIKSIKKLTIVLYNLLIVLPPGKAVKDLQAGDFTLMTEKKVMKLASRGKRFGAACIDSVVPFVSYLLYTAVMAANGMKIGVPGYGYGNDFGYGYG